MKGEKKTWPCLDWAVERPWLALAISLWFCMNELRKQSSGLLYMASISGNELRP